MMKNFQKYWSLSKILVQKSNSFSTAHHIDIKLNPKLRESVSLDAEDVLMIYLRKLGKEQMNVLQNKTLKNVLLMSFLGRLSSHQPLEPNLKEQ